MLRLLCLAYCIIFAGLAVSRNHVRWMHGIARAFGTVRSSDLNALIVVLPWFLASGAMGESKVKQSACTAKYCGEQSFLRDTRTKFAEFEISILIVINLGLRFFFCVFYNIKAERIQNLNSIGLLVSHILIHFNVQISKCSMLIRFWSKKFFKKFCRSFGTSIII